MGKLPTDRYGLALSTDPIAADLYNNGLDLILACDSNGVALVQLAVDADSNFALAHAVLGVVYAEVGQTRLAESSFKHAQQHYGALTAREVSCITALVAVSRGHKVEARKLLLQHLDHYPLDAFSLSVAAPTIAFSGVMETPTALWPLVESLVPLYKDDWWMASLMAFVRQDQERYEEAFQFADFALTQSPRSGHAVHARAHAFYETAAYGPGLQWLNSWLGAGTPDATLRGHMHWHAALHELCLGDSDAVSKRWDIGLRPPLTAGSRVLVDAGALLFRCRIRGGEFNVATVEEIARALDDGLVSRRQSIFVTLHLGFFLALQRDAGALTALVNRVVSDGGLGEIVLAPILTALVAYTEARYADAARLLSESSGNFARVGGSLAQREVLEELLISVQLAAGNPDGALVALAARHDADRTIHWVPNEVQTRFRASGQPSSEVPDF